MEGDAGLSRGGSGGGGSGGEIGGGEIAAAAEGRGFGCAWARATEPKTSTLPSLRTRWLRVVSFSPRI
ncbi:MAG: hypothetical protein KF718_06885 [Polyangiaceae bacterium]|nr:hypothetical protein [Polyangiaceae bacterium]